MAFDTSSGAAQAQASVWRSLGSGRRLEIACELSGAVRELARARIRADHPDYGEDQVRDLLIWELYGVRPHAE